ncbi:MAG: protein kinase domain-containing protein [Planctomycetales bacterium]
MPARHRRDSLETISQVAPETSIAPGNAGRSATFDPESEAAPPLSEFGRYRIVRLLGEGAMGRVYLAEDTQLQRQVALKVPQLEEGKDAKRLERFYREARLAATLNHPNICPIHDVGEYRGTHYISMGYVEGKPLAAYIQPDQPLPERTSASLLRKVALALQDAHRLGVIHRDLKPTNIMIDRRGEPIVMDFGLASQPDAADQAQITHTGAILGTPAYMSPEQVQGSKGPIGAVVDVYALGVVLYQLVTSRLPFEGPVVSVLAQIATQVAPPPSIHRPDLHPQLEAICVKAMAKDPAQRYASMQELAKALADFLRNTERAHSTVTAAPSDPFPEEMPKIQIEPHAVLETIRSRHKPKGRRTRAGGSADTRPLLPWKSPARWGAFAGVVAGVIALLFWLSGDKPKVPEPPRSPNGRSQGEAHDQVDEAVAVSTEESPASATETSQQSQANSDGMDSPLAAELAEDATSESPSIDDSIPAEDPSRLAKAEGDPGPMRDAKLDDGGTIGTVPSGPLPHSVKLFNGKDKQGWESHPLHPDGWRVLKGKLNGKGRDLYLYSVRDDFRDFELRMKARLGEGGFGGLWLRAGFGPRGGSSPQAGAPFGYKLIFNNKSTNRSPMGGLGPLTRTLVNPPPGLDTSETFDMTVRVQDNRFEVFLNGQIVCDGYDDARQFPVGRIVLQQLVEGKELEFESIEVTDLSPAPPSALPAEALEARARFQKALKTLQAPLLAKLASAEKRGRTLAAKAPYRWQANALSSRGAPPSIADKGYFLRLRREGAEYEKRLEVCLAAARSDKDAAAIRALETELRDFQVDTGIYHGRLWAVFQVTEKSTWQVAKTACEKRGGRLAIVRDDDENAFLVSLLKAQGLAIALLGATDEKQEGQWRWVDGAKMEFANWYNDGKIQQPNNRTAKGEPEHYLAIDAMRDGKWWDIPAAIDPWGGFVCEWDAER